MNIIGRNTFAVVNIEKYLKNLEFLNSCTTAKIMPVLKADAYGHGMQELGKAALKSGYDMFAVAFLEEALELLSSGILSKVLIFNYFDPKDLKSVLDYSDYLRPTITSIDFLEKACGILGKDIKKLVFHINVDTGMNRIGIREEELSTLIRLIKKNNINVEGIYSHFATADEKDEFVKIQYDKFLNILNYIINEGIDIKIRHLANSAGLLFFPQSSLDYVRPGVATFGMQPSNIIKVEELKPVMELKSTVAKINMVKSGESIGYGRTFITLKSMKTAIVPIGYADGYFRNLSNKAYVLINGKKCRILGNISMDQMVVDITEVNTNVGDEVVLIGEQDGVSITCEELAQKAGTINYEITSKLTRRVPRIYIRGGN